MRILIVTDSLGIGGAETHIKTLAAGLCALGENVTLAAPRKSIKGELPEGVEFIPMPSLSKAPIKMIWTYFALCRILRQGKYDIVHAHARLPALILRGLRRKGTVMTIHAKYPKSRSGKLIFSKRSPVICVSNDLCRHICSNFGVKRENVRVISNGIDTGIFCPPAEKRCGNRAIFVSRLDKNCSQTPVILCRIAGALRRRYRDFTLTIVGGGDQFSRIEALAEAINAALGADVIKMTGNVGQVAPLLQESDIFIGVSRAALEAAAVSLPVILSGDEGYGGIFEGEKMSRPDDKNLCARDGILPKSEYLFNDICKLFDMSREELEALGEAGREYVLRHHSAVSMARETLEVYRAALCAAEEKVISPRRQRRGKERRSSHPAC